MEEFNTGPTTRSFFPKEPVKQKESREVAIQETLDQLPLLKQIVEHLDKKIAFYDTLDSIPVDITTTPEVFQKIHYANRMTRDNLKVERNYIMSRIATVVR